MIECDVGACVQALKRALRTEDINSILEYIPDETTGAWLREPSAEVPDMTEFDSQHRRVNSPHQTFMFSHLVLGVTKP